MKKSFLIIGLLFSSILAMNAQSFSENAIGLRLGDNDGFGGEVSYQRKLSEGTRLEVDLGLRNNDYSNSFKLTGIHQWVWDLGYDNFNWYAGVGGGVGSWKNKISDSSSTSIFVAGDIGIEYNFEIPLMISLDLRPEIGFNDVYDGLNSDIALSLRYQF